MLEGDVTVTPERKEPAKFGAGDWFYSLQECIVNGMFTKQSASIIDLLIKF